MQRLLHRDPDSPQADSTSVTPALLAWYDRHRRNLPWRAKPGEAPDPYRVWLSEIMLQQTTVAAVKPYFAAFLERWPDITALAAAPVEAVMQQWAGLGYYSRARNLHACAKAIVAGFNGQFPQTEAALNQLPGIGAYTAAAIAAIAFGAKATVVDGNVARVVARLFAIDVPLPKAKPVVTNYVAQMTPANRAGDFAQAMMDLGATICTPRRPTCSLCPLRIHCAAGASVTPEDWPRKTVRPEKPQRRGVAFCLRRGDALLLRTRPPRGLLGGMAELPGTTWAATCDRAKALREAPLIADYRKLKMPVTHVFTHFSLSLDIFVADVAEATKAPAGCRWVSHADLDGEALPSVMRKIIAAVRNSGW